MHDLTDRLAEAGPPPPIVLDHVHLSGRARRIRRRQRLVGSAALCLAVVAAGAAGYTALGTDGPAVLEVAAPGGSGDAAGSDGGDQAAPVADGTYHWVEFPTLAGAFGDSSAVELADGRVFLLGQDQFEATGAEVAASAIGTSMLYDPADRSWTEVEPPPFEDVGRGWAIASGNEVLAILNLDDSHRSFAIYDAGAGTWTELPEVEIDLARVHFSDGTVILLSDRAGTEFAMGPDESRIVNDGIPQVLRWSPGQDDWEAGQPSPLTPRFGSGIAELDGKIYQVGGVPDGLDTSPGDHDGYGYLTDGAVYDIAGDTWSPVAAVPEGSDLLDIRVSNDDELVASASAWNGSYRESTGGYRLVGDAWEPIEPPSPEYTYLAVEEDGSLLARALHLEGGVETWDSSAPAMLLTASGWEETPSGSTSLRSGDVAFLVANWGWGDHEAGSLLVQTDSGQWEAPTGQAHQGTAYVPLGDGEILVLHDAGTGQTGAWLVSTQG